MSSTFSASPAGSSDRELMTRAAGGEEAAVGRLYDRYARVLHAVAYRIVGQRADAEEVVAETFAQAWRDAARFEEARGSVPAWLTMIARSRALDLTRARVRRDRATTSAGSEPGPGPAMGTWRSDPGEAVDADERQRKVREALAGLSAAQREAVELAFYEGLSQSEIALRLDEPLGTVKTRVRSAMQKLRDSLSPYFFERAE